MFSSRVSFLGFTIDRDLLSVDARELWQRASRHRDGHSNNDGFVCKLIATQSTHFKMKDLGLPWNLYLSHQGCFEPFTVKVLESGDYSRGGE